MEHTCSCNFDLKGEAKRARTKLSSPIIPSNSDKVFGTHKIRDKPIAPASPWQNGLAERLTRYKIPNDVVICPALPKTPVGKIDKLQLRAHGKSAP